MAPALPLAIQLSGRPTSETNEAHRQRERACLYSLRQPDKARLPQAHRGALCIKPLINENCSSVGHLRYKNLRLAQWLACFMHKPKRVSPSVTLVRPNFVHRYLSMGFL